MSIRVPPPQNQPGFGADRASESSDNEQPPAYFRPGAMGYIPHSDSESEFYREEEKYNREQGSELSWSEHISRRSSYFEQNNNRRNGNVRVE